MFDKTKAEKVFKKRKKYGLSDFSVFEYIENAEFWHKTLFLIDLNENYWMSFGLFSEGLQQLTLRFLLGRVCAWGDRAGLRYYISYKPLSVKCALEMLPEDIREEFIPYIGMLNE